MSDVPERQASDSNLDYGLLDVTARLVSPHEPPTSGNPTEDPFIPPVVSETPE